MNQLLLADLADLNDADVREHILNQWTDNGAQRDAVDAILLDADILIAYEHVGSWGCDSAAFYLLRRRSDAQLIVVHGSHCSCYGFEGQFEPEETDATVLKSDQFYFSTGGYDDDGAAHTAQAREFITMNI